MPSRSIYAVAIQCFTVVHLKSIKAYNKLRNLCMLLSIQIIEVLVLESLKSSGHMPQVDHGKLFWLGHTILGKLMSIVKGKWFYLGFPTPPPMWYSTMFVLGGDIFLFTVMHPIPICQIYIKPPHFERTVKSFAQILCFPNLPWKSSSK